MGTIIVKGLGKAFKRYPNRWARLAEWLDLRNVPHHELQWVLRDIEFTVQAGEAVGIIGINGAGKSTLLKLITGTSHPTTGSVQMSGRVAALLELGMGFHPDFTGRQNAYMAGQLLGISSEDITRLMPEIEAFAEIGSYIDQPVRVYSSGMQMRLAFSVATVIRPDILIVDEALSVGDSYFQHKSFDRIRQFRKQGTTLLIVSHDKQAIQSICDRAILLNAGTLSMQGKPEAVMDYYNALLADHAGQNIVQQQLDTGSIQTNSGTGEATISRIALLGSDGSTIEQARLGECIELRFDVEVHQPIDRLVLGFSIKDRLGQTMYGINTDLTNQPLYNLKPGDFIEYKAKFRANLGPGTYSVQVALVGTETHLVENFQWIDLAHMFSVINSHHPRFEGCNWLDAKISIAKESVIQQGS